MEVSVIIPVYNAEKFIEKAIHSALQQKEVKEIIIIDDAYPDDALLIAQKLQKQYPRIKIFQHPDKKNHGAGTSRNLGIKKATSPYIAFLDADDFYLPNRFKKTKKVFKENPEIDGVYEALGLHLYTKKNPNLYGQKTAYGYLATIDKEIAPKNLFSASVLGQSGYFTLDALTIKKTLIDKMGFFDPLLKQCQDTDFNWRATLYGQLLPGEISRPVSIRGVHEENRIHNTKESMYYKGMMYRKWFKLSLDNNWSKAVNYKILKNTIRYFSFNQRLYMSSRWVKYSVKFIYGLYLLIRYPQIIRKII